MTKLPHEARVGLMRAWLAILNERHPQYTWIAAEQKPSEETSAELADSLVTSEAG